MDTIARRTPAPLGSLLVLVLALVPAGAVAQAAEDFQQGVEYTVEARLDDASHVLTGRAELHYTNNASVPLDTLWFHQYLNAFRPNSAWARGDLEFDRRTFQDLGPQDHAFERLREVTVFGRRVEPVYPFAPDSTVFALALPEPLEPGATAAVRLDWTARLATVPRRQGREGVHYDWAHWYPRIAVYRPGGWEYRVHVRQGELNGEFGRYDVTLDVAADHVLAATGVPVSGDPGWAGAQVFGGEVDHRRDFYEAPPDRPLGLLATFAEAGRKRVRWVAERVHNFAWNASPTYAYAAGSAAGVPIHFLYEAADTTYDPATAIRRAEAALGWLAEFWGEYPYPQLTISDRVEGGGTEFPMIFMVGGMSQGLFVHEGAHEWVHGILANNEWRDGWLDEGFATFLTNWFYEEFPGGRFTPEQLWGRALERIAAMDRAGQSEPIDTPGAEFSSYQMYGAMTYTKASLVLRMLRGLVGRDTMRRICRTYYERNKFTHVTEADFRQAVEEVTGEDYGWFFDQWLRTTKQLDYAITEAETHRLPEGGWETRAVVERQGGAVMPVVVVAGDARTRIDGRQRRTEVRLVTGERPARVVLDPDMLLPDVDRSDNEAAPRGG